MTNISPSGTSQTIAISSTSAQSTPIHAVLVHITPTVDCYMRQGSNPVAIANIDHFLLGNATQSFRIIRDNILAFITAAGSGFVHIVPVD